MIKTEKRSAGLGVEVRAADDGKRTLVGYAAVFERVATISSYFKEQIASGAFADAIDGDILALVEHDRSRVVGRTKSGTLRLAEDGKGLRVEIDVPDTTVGNDLWVLVERGDIAGMSFGFRVVKETWDESTTPPTRTIEKLELVEVSAVTFPAYEDTEIGVRSLQEFRDAKAAAETPPEKTAGSGAVRLRLKIQNDLRERSRPR
ncbi:HK97 family phage prohead protease [Hansschlegelia beijingensis]|uniref:Prohead serine protease domain-containing protein n=1 Tax=Hansschlegelia beijingensis TaxID=1133344 RepID=A0A7W6CX72_9HYPH|nr:HK97 family phage prohead protease [Hansschlegelia beijingensis]MBB3972773.1 hypothetical protein [Hansschlegelia beijingensis]